MPTTGYTNGSQNTRPVSEKVTDNKEVPIEQKVKIHWKEVVPKNLEERGSVP